MPPDPMDAADQAILDADRSLRHSAVRKLHRARWATGDSEDHAAIADLRTAGAIVLKMSSPSGAALSAIATALDDLHQDRSPDIRSAIAALTLPGEFVTGVRGPWS